MRASSIVEPTSRDRVLDAAQQLIVDHGHVDFSMRELAELSGLAKATIYHHFPDKNAICLSVVEHEFLVLRDRINAAAESAADPVERLRRVIDAFFGLQLERRLMIVLTLRDVSGLGMQFKDAIAKYRHEIVSPIADIMEDGMQQGIFQPVNVEMTVISLLGMMQSYVTHRALIDPDGFADSATEHTLNLLLNGIGTGTGAETNSSGPL